MKTVAVWNSKGGVGKTTAAVNLAHAAARTGARTLLVPVIPTTLSMRTLEQVRTFVADGVKHPPEVMPFLSMVDRRRRMHLNICLRFLTDPDSFNTTIPSAAVIEKMGLTRAPVAATSPSQPAANAFAMLWHELNERLGL